MKRNGSDEDQSCGGECLHGRVSFLRCHEISVGSFRQGAHYFLADSGFAAAAFNVAGTANFVSSSGTFTSILSKVVFGSGSVPFGPPALQNGNITPFTGLYDPRLTTNSCTEPRRNSCCSLRISRNVSGSR